MNVEPTSTARPRRTALAGLARVALAGVVAAALTWQIARSWPAPPVERATLASVAFIPLWTGLALASLAWGRRSRRGAARRRLFALHRRLGGALVVVAVIVFGSGVGAVLDRSLARWQIDHAPPRAVPALSAQPLDAVLAAVLAEHPALAHGELALHPASAAHPWVQVDFLGPDRVPVRLDFDPRTATEQGRGRGPLWVLRELHRRLLVSPLIGETALGLVGLALALVLLAGLATRRNWLANILKIKRQQPIAMRLHQWIGLGTMPAALLWAASGALLGLTMIVVPIVGGAAYDGDRAALMRDVLAADRPAKSDRPAPLPDLQATVASSCPLLREQLPDAGVHRILVRHPGLRSGSVRVDLEGAGLLRRGSFHREFDGTLRDCRALPSAGAGLQTFMAAIVLHYGEWGPAWLVDILYLALGSALVGLAVLGGLLLARRRAREHDLAGARRAVRWLAGAGLGLALATAVLLVLSRVPAWARDESLALDCFVVVAGLVTIAAHTPARRALPVALGLTLAAVPVVGWFVGGMRPGPVEAAMLAIALVVTLAATRRRHGLANDLVAA